MDALPHEILSDIFLWCLPPPARHSDVPFVASVSAPLLISHVCRKWRSLALSYGELWSHLRINYSVPLDLRKRQMMVNIFDTWLSRTNGSPINFVFRCSLGEEDDPGDHRRAEYMITTLLSLQYRWKDVVFCWEGVQFSPESPGLDMLNMPVLTSLSLRVSLAVRVSISIAQSLHMKCLHLSGHFNLYAITEPLPFLTESKLEFWSRYGHIGRRAAQTCLGFLRMAPFLEQFEGHFRADLPISTGCRHEPSLVLRSLRSLKLEYGDQPSTVLDNVTLPSLEALYYVSDVEAGTFFNFFQRSKPPLTFLAIHRSCADEGEIIGILRLLPSLRDLRYSNACVSKRFFRELTVEIPENEDIPRSVEHIVCPGLEILHLHNLLPLDDSSECVETWISMLKSRARIQKSFERIYVDLDIGLSTVVNVSDIGDYTDALEHCFEDWEGQLIAGDYEYVFRHSFPPSLHRPV